MPVDHAARHGVSSTTARGNTDAAAPSRRLHLTDACATGVLIACAAVVIALINRH
ncbi:hypothetical protein ACGF5F_04940 [Streptomyces sp. NPDC047821]|uniref:hypothetical protein n=1 Tax=Streptomyces sp. NPDC047821 TaxID=3365488 RepID=UPI003723DFAB